MTKLFGKENGRWRGAKAGYAAVHLRNKKPRRKCERCAATKDLQWAQIHGTKRFKLMCRSCHSKYDHREKNLR